jgi:myosin heavy subunit
LKSKGLKCTLFLRVLNKTQKTTNNFLRPTSYNLATMFESPSKKTPEQKPEETLNNVKLALTSLIAVTYPDAHGNAIKLAVNVLSGVYDNIESLEMAAESIKGMSKKIDKLESEKSLLCENLEKMKGDNENAIKHLEEKFRQFKEEELLEETEKAEKAEKEKAELERKLNLANEESGKKDEKIRELEGKLKKKEEESKEKNEEMEELKKQLMEKEEESGKKDKEIEELKEKSVPVAEGEEKKIATIKKILGEKEKIIVDIEKKNKDKVIDLEDKIAQLNSVCGEQGDKIAGHAKVFDTATLLIDSKIDSRETSKLVKDELIAIKGILEKGFKGKEKEKEKEKEEEEKWDGSKTKKEQEQFDRLMAEELQKEFDKANGQPQQELSDLDIAMILDETMTSELQKPVQAPPPEPAKVKRAKQSAQQSPTAIGVAGSKISPGDYVDSSVPEWLTVFDADGKIRDEHKNLYDFLSTLPNKPKEPWNKYMSLRNWKLVNGFENKSFSEKEGEFLKDIFKGGIGYE